MGGHPEEDRMVRKPDKRWSYEVIILLIFPCNFWSILLAITSIQN